MIYFLIITILLLIGVCYAYYRLRQSFITYKNDVYHYKNRKRRQLDLARDKLRLVNLTLGGICIYRRIEENQKFAEYLVKYGFDLLKKEPRLRQSLVANHQFFRQICDIMEFRDPSSDPKKEYKRVPVFNSFWLMFQSNDWQKLQAIDGQLHNLNRCPTCLQSGTVGIELAAKGICGGCGMIGFVYDPVKIEMVKALMDKKLDETNLWPVEPS